MEISTMWRSRVLRRCLLVIVLFGICGHFLWQNFSGRDHNENIKGNLYEFTKDTNNSDKDRIKPDIPILLWWDSVYTDVDEIRQCGDKMCRITNNKQLRHHPDTSVFLFYGSKFKPFNLPLPRKPHHLWALMHEESPRNAYILSHHPALTIFNFTSTYSRRTDYPITLQWLPCPDWLHDKTYMLPLVDKNRLRNLGLAPILYIQSDCDVPSDRDSFVKQLQRYIPIDSYGTCINNKKMDKKLRFHDNMAPLEDENFYRFAARYKFTLAMENYVCDDYITEKVWRPLRLGSVPIMFSAPNIWEYMPSNKSAINIVDFEDIEDLADYIHLLDNNDKLYKQYLSYKNEKLENKHLKQILEHRDWISPTCNTRKYSINKSDFFTKKHPSIFSGYECFLCNKVHEIYGSNFEKTFQAEATHYGCPSPRKFDIQGHYSIHDDRWAAEWNYGKYEAEAMLKMYRENLVMSEKDYYKYVKKVMRTTDSY
ncbi:Alpha-(1 3)-fucosyltransferase 11 [Mactra antiquata]